MRGERDDRSTMTRYKGGRVAPRRGLLRESSGEALTESLVLVRYQAEAAQG